MKHLLCAVCRLVLAAALVPALVPSALAGPAEDGFIAGYAAAILEREFRVEGAVVSVRDGVVTLAGARLPAGMGERVAAALRQVRGVAEVVVVAAEAPTAVPAAGAASGTVEAAPPPVLAPASGGVAATLAPVAGEVLPRRPLFAPLLADPRWPHFSAAYQNVRGDPELDNAAAVSFGETFGFYRDRAPFGGQWELGLQAAVFAIFDLDSDSFDLVNADYWVGIPVSYRLGAFSAIARLFHQSSHLGDEYLLRRRVDRVNLSYEAVDLKLSYEIGDAWRVYGGPGYLVHTDPEDIDPASFQLGAEYVGTEAWAGAFRPVAAADIQWREEGDSEPDISLRAGVQLESNLVVGRRLQVVFEYFNGRSPNGQFFERDIHYVGLGAHLYF